MSERKDPYGKRRRHFGELWAEEGGEQSLNLHNCTQYMLIHGRGSHCGGEELERVGSIVKEPIAFIERLLYVMHYTRCLAYTHLFSPHNNPGKQYSYLVLQMKKLKLKEIKRHRVLPGAWIWPPTFIGSVCYSTLGYDIRRQKRRACKLFNLGLLIQPSCPTSTPTVTLSPRPGSCCVSWTWYGLQQLAGQWWWCTVSISIISRSWISLLAYPHFLADGTRSEEL